MQKLSFEELDTNNLEEKELDKLIEDIKDINEINALLDNIVLKQHENITKIELITETSVKNSEKGLGQVVLANDYYKSYKYNQGLLIATSVLVITCPVTLLVGLKAGIISGAVSSTYGLYKYIS